MKTIKPFCWILALFFYTTTASALDASITHACFQSPEQNYIELYFHIVGKTTSYASLDSTNYQATIQVITIFRKAGEIVKYDKYNLNSPKTDVYLDFIDLKRYVLDDGEYNVEVFLQDMNNVGNSKTISFKTTLKYQPDQLTQSDIQLLSSMRKDDNSNNPFIKSGYYLEALPFSFYPKTADKLIFYNEIYGATQFIQDDFLVRYKIVTSRNIGEEKDILVMNKKQKPLAVNPVLLQMDISKIPSGNYVLKVELINRAGELLSTREAFFQRSKPYLKMDEEGIAEPSVNDNFAKDLDEEKLRYALKAIAPVIASSQNELLNEVIRSRNPDFMKRFLLNYWFDQNPESPGLAYSKFMEVASAVDKLYKSGFGYGFETDRGYTFMKYGKPDHIVMEDTEVDAPPYEIWTYNSVLRTKQTNVKFVFYNPTLAPGDFVFLHSTARGEISDPDWQSKLYGRSGTEGFNKKAERLFSDY